MYKCVWKTLNRVLFLTAVISTPVGLWAQVAPSAAGNAPSPSKWDVFAGYSALIPNGHVGTAPKGEGFGYNSIDMGAILSITRFFNNYVGVRIEGDEHILTPESNITWDQPGDDFSGGYGGVVFRIPMHSGKVTPSFHVLGGMEQVGSIYQTDVFGPALTAGGSLDVALNHRLSIRLFQADYQWVHANFPADQGGSVNFNPQGRLGAGLVWSAGTIAPPVPIGLSCSPSQVSIFPGDPLTVTATDGNQNPKMNVVYSWSGTGVSGTGTTVTVATASLAPGSYTVQGTVKEGRPGREGLKPWETATCSAVFTVKAIEPPTISCSANPVTIKPGDFSTITSVAMSPQNRPLTYTYSATAGTVSGSGPTAQFSSAGAASGTVGITCNVADDKGQTATANTNVEIVAPVPVTTVQPHAQALCSINFSRDASRPTRVDNEAKACLDQVALSLQQQGDTSVYLVGESTTNEKNPSTRHRHAMEKDFAAQRAVNTKNYLVTEKGIDANRIHVVTGSTDGQTVEDYLVPAGASFTTDVQGTTPVDELTIKPQARKPLSGGHRHAAAPTQ
jgi:hypothetical protein